MIYMIADNSLQKRGIWKSDGTANGTVLIQEITNARTYGNSIRQLTYSDGKLYFIAEAESGLKFLYKVDAVQSGTASLVQLNSIIFGPEVLINVNGTLYFGGEDGLMKTDGTVAGTVLVKKLF